MQLNRFLQKLPGSYLFEEVRQRTEHFQAEHPDARLLSLGIGDVTHPLVPAVVDAMKKAAEEMGTEAGFRGYGPVQGYHFLRQAIAQYDYQARGAKICPEDIFLSDGAKTDTSAIWELFGRTCRAAVCDPGYPVYAESRAAAGLAGTYCPDEGHWSGLTYLPCTAGNGFVPEPPSEQLDLVYLCFPNNPTGAAASAAQLRKWVAYADSCGAVLLYDAAYEAFLSDPELPHSIFEIPGAENCAIEFRSFSKTAGFTGTRCAFTVIPSALQRCGAGLQQLWHRRQSVHSNGVSYLVQRGAEAVYTPEGRAQIGGVLAQYQRNAERIRVELAAAGLQVYGGQNSPYIWAKVPGGKSSWEFFELLLRQAQVVVTPGAGFGPGGEGYVRLSALGDRLSVQTAVERICSVL